MQDDSEKYQNTILLFIRKRSYPEKTKLGIEILILIEQCEHPDFEWFDHDYDHDNKL